VTKFFTLFVLIFLTLLPTEDLQAQKRKKNKAGAKEQFIPQTIAAKKQGPLINPVRKALNMLNFSIEAGTGFFNHSQNLDNLVVVRTDNPGSFIYAFPIAEAPSGGPYNAAINWFNGSQERTVNQIHDQDFAVSTDTLSVQFENQGNYTPITFRLSFSIKKTDKAHLKTTGERRTLDKDILRIGGGISVGRVKYKNNFFTAKDIQGFGQKSISVVKTSQKKFFGSLSVSVLNNGDLTMFMDFEAGTWQFKSEDFNSAVVKYDPFFSVGLTFEKEFSKYFKMYLRPAVEFRNYQLETEEIIIPNKLNMFSMNIGFLLKYPTYPRNRYQAHRIQMEHVFNGKVYRGRSIFRKQNPRIGQNMPRQKRR